MSDAAPAGYLAEQLRTELARNPRTHELGIRVSVLHASRCVVLCGLVATAERRDSIEALARELLPGFEVRNEIGVQSMHGPGLETLS